MFKIFPPEHLTPVAIEWGALLNVKEGQWWAPDGPDGARLKRFATPAVPDDGGGSRDQKLDYSLQDEGRAYVMWVPQRDEANAVKKGVTRDGRSGAFLVKVASRTGGHKASSGGGTAPAAPAPGAPGTPPPIGACAQWMTPDANMAWHQQQKGRGILGLISAVLRMARGVVMLLPPVPPTALGRQQWLERLRSRPFAEVRQSIALTSQEVGRLSKMLDKGGLDPEARWRNIRRLGELSDSLTLARREFGDDRHDIRAMKEAVARHLIRRATGQFGPEVSKSVMGAEKKSRRSEREEVPTAPSQKPSGREKEQARKARAAKLEAQVRAKAIAGHGGSGSPNSG